MKKYLLILGFLATISSCQDVVEPSQSFDISGFEVDKLSNSSQYGDLLYKQLKYYNATVDPFSFIELTTEEDEDFRSSFDSFYSSGTGIEDPMHFLNEGLKRGFVSDLQHKLLNNYLDDVVIEISTTRSLDELESIFDNKAEEISSNPNISDFNKESLLVNNYVAKAAMKYYWEMNFDPSLLDSNAKIQSACGFWAKAACYLTNIIGLASSTSGILGTASKAAWGTGLWQIGAVVGVAVGIYNGITSCSCDTSVCQSFEGVAVPFACYVYGNSLTFKGWGQGNIAASSYEWDFYKNDNLNTASNFYSGFSTGDSFVLPGSYLNSSINTVAVKNKAICSGIQKFSPNPFGWFDLSELGKPTFVIAGPSTIPVSQTGYNWTPQLYEVQGKFGQNTTLAWEIIPSGYPNYSATGTFTGGSNTHMVTIRWNSSPGMATVKLTATTSCSVDVRYFNVHITANQPYY